MKTAIATTWTAITTAEWYGIEITDGVCTYESDDPRFEGVLTVVYSSVEAERAEAWDPGSIERAMYEDDYVSMEWEWPCDQGDE